MVWCSARKGQTSDSKQLTKLYSSINICLIAGACNIATLHYSNLKEKISANGVRDDEVAASTASLACFMCLLARWCVVVEVAHSVVKNKCLDFNVAVASEGSFFIFLTCTNCLQRAEKVSRCKLRALGFLTDATLIRGITTSNFFLSLKVASTSCLCKKRSNIVVANAFQDIELVLGADNTLCCLMVVWCAYLAIDCIVHCR